MPQRMLRDVMSVNDIYAYAEPIMAMLREAYGTYDADALDEVLVDDSFVHRLQARGYEVLVSIDAVEETPAAPRTTRRRTTTTSSAQSKAPEAEAKPASRTRRTTAASSPPATPDASNAAEPAPTPRRTTRRTTRTTRASSDGEGSEA